MTNKSLTDSERIEKIKSKCFEYLNGDLLRGEFDEIIQQRFDEIRKESYEQGFKDACEKWEKIFDKIDDAEFCGNSQIEIKNYLLSLAEKEGILTHKEK